MNWKNNCLLIFNTSALEWMLDPREGKKYACSLILTTSYPRQILREGDVEAKNPLHLLVFPPTSSQSHQPLLVKHFGLRKAHPVAGRY